MEVRNRSSRMSSFRVVFVLQMYRISNVHETQYESMHGHEVYVPRVGLRCGPGGKGNGLNNGRIRGRAWEMLGDTAEGGPEGSRSGFSCVVKGTCVRAHCGSCGDRPNTS